MNENKKCKNCIVTVRDINDCGPVEYVFENDDDELGWGDFIFCPMCGHKIGDKDG